MNFQQASSRESKRAPGSGGRSSSSDLCNRRHFPLASSWHRSLFSLRLCEGALRRDEDREEATRTRVSSSWSVDGPECNGIGVNEFENVGELPLLQQQLSNDGSIGTSAARRSGGARGRE